MKKLIKHDQRTAKSNKENISQTTCTTQCNETALSKTNFSVFTCLHNASTKASRAKKTVKKESIISVEIKTVTRRDKHRDICPKKNGCEPAPKTCKSPLSSMSEICCKSATTETDSNLMKSSRPTKSSLGRPKKQVKLTKHDPVARYHEYKEGWNKMKVPGENGREHLRWAIREKMLGPFK